MAATYPAHARRTRGLPARRTLPRLLILALCMALVSSVTAVGSSPGGDVSPQALTPARSPGWYLQDAGTDEHLASVHFIDQDTGWVCGANGTLLKTTDGGATWMPKDPGTDLALTSVFFIDANTGWVVGDDGFVAASSDGGETWDPQTSGTDRNLWSVQFLDANNGWIVGVPGKGDGPPPVGVYGPILKTTDGGETWVDQGNDTWSTVQSVFFFDADHGWITGNEVLIRTTDGGDTWEDVRPDFLSEPALYRTPYFVDANTGWVVGGDGLILHTTDGGDTWQQQESGRVGLPRPNLPGGAGELIDVHFVNANTGWVTGNQGVVLATYDGGVTWYEEQSGGTRYFRDVFFIDENTGWAVGSDGQVVAFRWPLPPVLEVEGANRYLTAVDASRRAHPTGADTVVIATARNWPDALGGTALAGALRGPVLLTNTNTMPDAVIDEVERLQPYKAIIVGGTTAVGEDVETALEGLLGEENVERIEGRTRYLTADAVALRVIEELGAGYDGTAFVATGGNFPDALAAAPLAASQGWPLFLAHPTRGLSDATKAAMVDVDNAVILGGEAAVSDDVEAELLSDLPGTIERLGGDDRFETAVTIATFAVDVGGHGWDRVGITTGMDFPDALAGGVLQGEMNSVMLLTRPTSLNTHTGQALVTHGGEIASVTFFGGLNAVTQGVRDDVLAAIP